MKVSLLVLSLAVSLAAARPALPSCSCIGTNCSCSCTGPNCVCTCDGGCDCKSKASPWFSVPSGMTIDAAADLMSKATGEGVLVLSGGEQMVPVRLDNTTLWQALARLSSVPGVELGVGVGLFHVQRPRQFSPTERISFCTEGVDLATALDAISEASGAAFEASGTPMAKVKLKTKGTVAELVEQIAARTGTAITVTE